MRMARSMRQSRSLAARAEKLFPGGVNSPVRAFRSVGGEPPIIIRAAGSKLWDADNNEYVDYVGSWGPMILGHADPAVVEAVQRAAQNGTSFGASTPAEAELAELVTEAFPSVEMMRFVSSGTESAIPRSRYLLRRTPASLANSALVARNTKSRVIPSALWTSVGDTPV